MQFTRTLSLPSAASATSLLMRTRLLAPHRVKRESHGSSSSIERPYRTTTYNAASRTSMTAISQLGQWCRDLHSSYESAFAALPDDLRKQIAA